MGMIGYFTSQAVVALPTLLVLGIGVVLLISRGRKFRPRATGFAIAGVVVLLSATIASVTWNASLFWLLRDGGLQVGGFAAANLVVGLVLAMMQATGLALLVASVLVGEPAPVPAEAPESPPPGFAAPPRSPIT